MLSTLVDDTAPLLPVLMELWHRRKISSRMYRAFFYARGRSICKVETVGELRRALRQPGAPYLMNIPHLGHVSIAQLRILFSDHPQA